MIKDGSAKVEFSQDSVLFDTVFTSIGSATQNIRVRNKNNQRIKISSIILEGGNSSQFIVNVDGAKGISFSDLEIAANDSMYIFVQVNVNPNNANSPLIISDALKFVVNGNEQKVVLEAWGQDAYYHRPDSVIKFQDGSYFPYSVANAVPNSYDLIGGEFVWKNDKPHVIYGYLVVDEFQKLRIKENTKVYLNYKAGIWVYEGGQIRVLGKKDQEVVFQGARREKDFADEPGQWDRIWINEGSLKNEIDYAIIKNGFIGVQAELVGKAFYAPKRLKITNTKIQNMSLWGLYGVAFNIYGGNNVISNCQENSVNIALGGNYTFINCTFSNFWSKDKAREKPTVSINNNVEGNIFPLDTLYFGNCIIDGKLGNELKLDIKAGLNGTVSITPSFKFNNCWIKTTASIADQNIYLSCVKDKTSLNYKDIDMYNFEPAADETRHKGFSGTNAVSDAKKFPNDINMISRSASIANNSITVGAYE